MPVDACCSKPTPATLPVNIGLCANCLQDLTAYNFRGGSIRYDSTIVKSLARYINHGIRPGNFLEAVLKNNLTEAVLQADPNSLLILVPLVGLIYARAPAGCWGGKRQVDRWIAMHVKTTEEESNEA